jgi:O-antigen/teichoic acid export membrane protein
LSFAIARGVLFAAPIAVANLLPLDLYGKVEFAQSVASVLTLVLGFGLTATVPLILLREEVEERWDTLLLLVLGIAGFFAAVGGGIALLYGTVLAEGSLIALFTASLILQGYWATVLKSHDITTPALILEGGLWVVLLLGAVSAMAAGKVWSVVPLMAVAYGASLFIYTLRRCSTALRPFSFLDVKANLKLGLPFVATGVLSTLLGTLGRLTIGGFGEDLTMATYAILFRTTSAALVAHQLLMISFFRSLYLWDFETLRRRSPIIVLGVSAAVVVFLLLAGPLGWMLGPAFVEAWEQYRLEGSLILIQTLLWSGIAVNDFLTARLGIAAAAARWGVWFLLAGVPGFLAFVLAQHMADTSSLLRSTVLAHSVMLLGYYLVQCAVIRRSGHHFEHLWGLTLACLSILSVVVALLELA